MAWHGFNYPPAHNGAWPFMEWVAGRYYTAGLWDRGATTTIASVIGTLYGGQIVIPNTVTITAAGAEVSTAGGAGSLFRVGLYHDTGKGWLGKRVFDTGTIAGDATGLQSANPAALVRPGYYWAVILARHVTTTITFRASSNDCFHGLGAPISAITQTLQNGARLTIMDRYFDLGLPLDFPVLAIDSSGEYELVNNATMPRIIFGV
jgi:hypothetical protein